MGVELHLEPGTVCYLIIVVVHDYTHVRLDPLWTVYKSMSTFVKLTTTT